MVLQSGSVYKDLWAWIMLCLVGFLPKALLGLPAMQCLQHSSLIPSASLGQLCVAISTDLHPGDSSTSPSCPCGPASLVDKKTHEDSAVLFWHRLSLWGTGVGRCLSHGTLEPTLVHRSQAYLVKLDHTERSTWEDTETVRIPLEPDRGGSLDTYKTYTLRFKENLLRCCSAGLGRILRWVGQGHICGRDLLGHGLNSQCLFPETTLH
jgi:hypothetical protein